MRSPSAAPAAIRFLLLPVLLLALAGAAGAQGVPDTTRRPRPDTLRIDTLRIDSLVPIPADTAPAPALPTPAPAAVAPAPGAAPVDTARPADSRLTPATVRAAVRLPVAAGRGGRVLHVQVLLGAAGFSPGVLDGSWQEGTSRAVRAFREAHGLGAGEAVDEATYRRLLAAANGRPPLVEYRLAASDVSGPLRRIPSSYYDKARLDCMCYETVGERLAERFHTTPDVLRALNGGIDLNAVKPGTTLTVPNVWRLPPRSAPARLTVHKRDGMLRGYDAAGALLFTFRASVGSAETPSPSGRLKVLKVTRRPWYQYNPRVLSGRASAKGRTADLPPGPNSPVGMVWIQLSKAHVGIHGTPEPARVGRGQSHGCVRLTNWDALYLAGLLTPGVVVDFI